MDRPNQPDAPNGRWVDSGENGQEGTAVRAKSLNDLWDEVIGVIEASGQTPDASDVTQLRTAIAGLSGSGGGLKNWLTNGTLEIWQRGESFDVTPDPIYTADRWEVQSDSFGAAGLGRVTRETGGVQPGIIAGTWDYLRYEPLVAADGGGPAIRTKVEVLRELSDRRSTYSFLARAETAITVNVEISTIINSTITVLENVEVPIGQQWGRHSVSFDIANLLAQQIATNGTDHLQIQIRLPNLDSNSVDFGRLQLEEGGAPSDFEQRDPALEYLLCRRYYQTSLDLGEVPQSGNLSHYSIMARGGHPEAFMAVRFTPPMRIPPSVTYFSGATAGQIFWDGALRTVGGTLAIYRSRVALPPPQIVGGAPSQESRAQFNFTADAEI